MSGVWSELYTIYWTHIEKWAKDKQPDYYRMLQEDVEYVDFCPPRKPGQGTTLYLRVRQLLDENTIAIIKTAMENLVLVSWGSAITVEIDETLPEL